MLAVGQKWMGLREAGLIRAMAPMGAGIGATGGPCGALIGGVAAVGLALGKTIPEQEDDPRMWKAAREFYRRFESEVVAPWGSAYCRDIAGVDWRDAEATRAFYEGEKVQQCAAHTGKAARILGEILEKYWGPQTGDR